MFIIAPPLTHRTASLKGQSILVPSNQNAPCAKSYIMGHICHLMKGFNNKLPLEDLRLYLETVLTWTPVREKTGQQENFLPSLSPPGDAKRRDMS